MERPSDRLSFTERIHPCDGDGNIDGSAQRFGTERGRIRSSRILTPEESTETMHLRRPHSASTTSVAVSTNKPATLPYDSVKNSTLSATAAEFVPKTNIPCSTQQSYVSNTNISKFSAQSRLERARGIPEQLHNPQQIQQRQPIRNVRHEYNDDTLQGQLQVDEYTDNHEDIRGTGDNIELKLITTLQHLTNEIYTLTVDPGAFDKLIPTLLNIIKPHLEIPYNTQEILLVIIRQSIYEANFRYNGARLCANLDSTIPPEELTSFRNILFSLCQKETQSQALAWQTNSEHKEDDQKYCHGLIVFLAELVTQMEDALAFELGKLLVELINVVLKNPAPNSAKHICQALKLAGQTLERDKRGSRKDMENMMRALTELVTEGRVDSYIGHMVHNVRELRNGNWGQNTVTHSSSSTETGQVVEPQHAIDEPVLYGPDGNVLSAEESEFLQDITQNTTDLDDQGGPENEYGDVSEDDMDEAVAAAYEEFLNYSKQK